MPLILGLFGLGCIFGKKDIQEHFISGANDGVKGTFSLIPILVLIMTSTSMFYESGACDYLSHWAEDLTSLLGIPSELTSLIIIRPLSGSGSTALLTETLEKYGPDSLIGVSASIMCASSDTVFYITALYTSAAGVKSGSRVLLCALSVMLIGTVLSCLIARFCV
jgi:spore maturation protein B